MARRAPFIGLSVLLTVAACAGAAQAADFRVVVVPGLRLDDLRPLVERGAVGLVVPDAGPETSEARARAALARGSVTNSLLGTLPEGPALVEVETAAQAPSPDGLVVVLALPEGGVQPNDRRYPIAVLGGDFGGLLTSESTRIPGLVSIADVARLELGSRPDEDPVSELRTLDRRIEDNSRARLPASLLAGALVVVLALVSRRAALLGLCAGLAANLVLGALGASRPWVVLLDVGLAVAVGGPVLAYAIRSRRALGLVCAAVIAGYLLAMGLDESSVALSPLGPMQNARFYGLSNLLATMLLVPALVGAAALGGAGFAAVAALAFVTVAASRFGADGGGAVVLGVGYAVLAAALARASRGSFALAVAVALALVGALLALDAATGGSSHVTRALEAGPESLWSDLERRVSLSWARAVSHWSVALVVAAALAGLALLVGRGRRTPLTAALAAAIAVSLVVNDSPGDVALAGLVLLFAVERLPADAVGNAPRSPPEPIAPAPPALPRR